jgi:hypothetical protein
MTAASLGTSDITPVYVASGILDQHTLVHACKQIRFMESQLHLKTRELVELRDQSKATKNSG